MSGVCQKGQAVGQQPAYHLRSQHTGRDGQRCGKATTAFGAVREHRSRGGAHAPDLAAEIGRRYNPLSASIAQRSATRQAYPHSLSYQAMALTSVPPMTMVLKESKMLLWGSPLKSDETSGSSQ